MALHPEDVNKMLFGVVASIAFLAVVFVLLFVCCHLIELGTSEAISEAIKLICATFVSVLGSCVTVMKVLSGGKTKVTANG